MTSRGGKGAAGDDPFANVNLDGAWAQAATVRERSAAERDWAARNARWAAQDRQAARQRRRPRSGRVWPWLALVAVAVGLLGVQRLTGWQPGVPVVNGSGRQGMPPAGEGEQPGRILPAVTTAEPSHDFVLAQTTRDGSPVTFSPCRVWPVVVNVDDSPPGGYEQAVRAVREVSRRTGIAFVVEGTTGELTADSRAAYQPDLYGDRWAPILIAWTRGGWEAGFAGHGGPTAITLPNGDSHYVTGQITLDANGTFNRDPVALRAVLLHEFGHVAGLKHAVSGRELMAASNTGQTAYGPGDRAGLATLGQGECTDDV